MSALKYRPDVDGLRAVAVLAVIAYHFDYPGASGGFIGVDIFFVISGFLITGLIAREIDAREFSLVDFYKRRVRRIFPALFLMMAVVSVAGFWLLMSNQLETLRANMLSASLFSSNLYFWQQADYFSGPGVEQPLLHTWSLAVEEQFYLFFPLLLMALGRWLPGQRKLVLWLVTGASLVLSVKLVHTDPDAAFYLLPARAWELGFGALLAVGAVPAIKPLLARHAASVAGIALIAYSGLHLTPDSLFPGRAAVPSVLGAALLIHAGPASAVGRLLALKPVVWVGLLSYSLYLWHWPVMVFWKSYHPGRLDLPAAVALTALSIALAYASLRFVERPLRKMRIPSVRELLAAAAVPIAIACLVGLLAPSIGGGVRPESEQVEALLSHLDDSSAKPASGIRCFLTSTQGGRSLDPECLTRDDTRPDYLLFGDSHANDLAEGLRTTLPGVHVLQATASGCKPIEDKPGQARCTRVRDEVLDEWLPAQTTPVDAIVVSARWIASDIKGLSRTVAVLRTHATRVIVVGPHVEYEASLPALLARGLIDEKPGLAREHRLLKSSVDRRLGAAVTAAGGEYISMIETLCPGGTCREYVSPDVPMAYDYGHLTREGAVVFFDAVHGRLTPGPSV